MGLNLRCSLGTSGASSLMVGMGSGQMLGKVLTGVGAAPGEKTVSGGGAAPGGGE